MSENSSFHTSLLHLHLLYNNHLPFDVYCYTTRPSSFIFTVFILTNILLLLPLCIFIIYQGLQQWRQKCSTSSAASMSHSDSFTYNMVIMELFSVLGFILSFCGIYCDQLNLTLAGNYLLCFNFYGEMFFHVLTCVERYLAVVYPITYLSLRKERGIRIRNISISCVWLFCFIGMGLIEVKGFIYVNLSIVISSLSIVLYCSVSVLCVLIRSGPREQGEGSQRIDQSKQRAFYTIMVILGVLVLRFSSNVVWVVLSLSERSADCVIITSGFWFNLPGSLVLPLLFLHRAGKLVCWKKNIK